MARPDLLARLQDQRKLRQAQGRIRVRRSVGRRDGVRLEVGGKWLTGFCSNDLSGAGIPFHSWSTSKIYISISFGYQAKF